MCNQRPRRRGEQSFPPLQFIKSLEILRRCLFLILCLQTSGSKQSKVSGVSQGPCTTPALCSPSLLLSSPHGDLRSARPPTGNRGERGTFHRRWLWGRAQEEAVDVLFGSLLPCLQADCPFALRFCAVKVAGILFPRI